MEKNIKEIQIINHLIQKHIETIKSEDIKRQDKELNYLLIKEAVEALVREYKQSTTIRTKRYLQKSIIEVEEHLQAARRMYNANVSTYNQMIVTFPISIIANSKGMVKKDFFEAEETKKADVKISL